MIIDAANFKELEGKFNTLMVVHHNDGKRFTISELIDLIMQQRCSESEKIHLAIGAMHTIGKLQAIDREKKK